MSAGAVCGVRRRAAVGGLAALALCATLSGCGNMSFLVTPVPAAPELREHELLRESIFASDRVAVLDVHGLISNSRAASLIGPEGDNPVVMLKEKLDLAERDNRVKAVVLRINSPGGTVTGSDLMYSELQAFRRRTGKPVVACMLDMATSGGYYIACAADRIYAHPTTVTGSIGVIMITPNLTGLMNKIGVDVNVFKSGELKDAGSPFRDMTERDRRVLQNIIDQMYERFFAVVRAARRNVPEEQLRGLADGRVYYAGEAKESGLVDEIGGLFDAVREARRLAGIDGRKIVVVEYARDYEYRPNIYAQAPLPAGGAQVNLLNLDLPDSLLPHGAQFMYLWSPGQ